MTVVLCVCVLFFGWACYQTGRHDGAFKVLDLLIARLEATIPAEEDSKERIAPGVRLVLKQIRAVTKEIRNGI